jgi:hypothetical protein
MSVTRTQFAIWAKTSGWIQIDSKSGDSKRIEAWLAPSGSMVTIYYDKQSDKSTEITVS